MTSRDFCYWLQGYFEIHNENMPDNMKASLSGLTNHQTDLIRRHLALVFKHEIDPSAGSPEHQAELNAVHNGMTPEQVDEMKKRLEELEKRPPQKVVHHHSDPGMGLIRC